MDQIGEILSERKLKLKNIRVEVTRVGIIICRATYCVGNHKKQELIQARFRNKLGQRRRWKITLSLSVLINLWICAVKE